MKTIEMSTTLQKKMVDPLGKMPLFQNFPPDRVLSVISHATVVQFDAGETIYEEGSESRDMHVLVRGEVSISVHKGQSPDGREQFAGTFDQVEIGRVVAPEVVGEMSLLLGQPRTASVVACSTVLALRFEAAVFEAMCQKLPFFSLTIARVLAARLAQTNRLVPLPRWKDETQPPADVSAMLPVALLERQRIFPLATEGDILTLGFVEDPESGVLCAVRDYLPGITIRPVTLAFRLFDRFMKGLSGQGERHAETIVAGGGAIELDLLLRRLVAEGASDLHLSGGQAPRWRVDGQMRTIEDARPLGSDEVRKLVDPILDDRARGLFASKDCDLAYEIPGVARFRVNLFVDHGGVSAVMRVIPSRVLTFEQLGLPKVVESLCENPKGLVVVTGPTGSGKSTTLATMIDALNKKRRDHIITLEDPIEFLHKSQGCLVNQREIGTHTESFARALRAALREDPDIVLVGEMRDLETVSLALETANTGHLVFGTLHTSTAVSTVDRIINLFTPEEQSQVRSSLADVLRGVIAQTLCRKIGGGRVAALEVLVVNHAVANMIREGKTHQIPSCITTGKSLGNIALNEDLARLVAERKVEYEEALVKAVDKPDLARRCGKGEKGEKGERGE
jgi:twitching motility protein PilT